MKKFKTHLKQKKKSFKNSTQNPHKNTSTIMREQENLISENNVELRLLTWLDG